MCKTIGLSQKLNKFWTRSSLITISFIRPHLDYADVILIKLSTKASIENLIPSMQYNAVRPKSRRINIWFFDPAGFYENYIKLCFEAKYSKPSLNRGW